MCIESSFEAYKVQLQHMQVYTACTVIMVRVLNLDKVLSQPMAQVLLSVQETL